MLALVAALAAASAARAATPFVKVDAALDSGRTAIVAHVQWNAAGIQGGMVVGDLRAVAVDAGTTVPTLLGTATETLQPGQEARTETFKIDKDKRDALSKGNRVVVTATQHPPVPFPTVAASVDKAYVTVGEIQAGPKRGRVGRDDCSDRSIGTEPGVQGLLYCDLVGASLTALNLSGQDMRMSDFTGGVLRYAGLSGAKVSGGRLSGVDASRMKWSSTEAVGVTAPRFVAQKTRFDLGTFLSSTLDGADFSDSTFNETSFDNVTMGKGSFNGATIEHVDLAFARLRGADLGDATIDTTSMYFANLAGATLLGATIGETLEHDSPLRYATLCRTVMPRGLINNRDCKRRR
jgi:hypothetical protein